jgi:hypothetical protein
MFGPQLKSPVVLAEAGEASASADDAVAHGMYERMGFVRTPERDWAYSPTVHLRCYVLPL